VSPEQDFREYVLARQRALLRTAWLLTGDWAAAEDLVQTALMRAWPRWGRLAGGDGADHYVRRVLLNTFNSSWRRKWRGEAPTQDLPDGPAVDGQGRVDLRMSLTAAVRTLPPRQRAVVVLRYFDDQSEAQTAAVLGIAVGTVKSQAAKALATLRADPALAGLDLQETST
jgi:RNA polymerase sigma-70 factor (sigma-E family)